MTSDRDRRAALADIAVSRLESDAAGSSRTRRSLRWTAAACVAVALLAVAGFGLWRTYDDAVNGGPNDAGLVKAVGRGDADRVAALLARGADPDADTFGDGLFGPVGESALHLAVRNGDAEIVALLLKAGADPNRQEVGRPPLDFAAPGSEAERLLIGAGATRSPSPAIR